jgi:hypothetical protein
MTDFTAYGAFGTLGVILYLGAYGALQAGLIRGSSLTYTLLNLCAAASVLFSLMETWNLYSALIQGFWIAISIMGIGRRLWLRSRRSFDDETMAFLARHLPTLPLFEAHRLTRHASWRDHPSGTALARQGQSVDALIYLAEGTATVEVDGRPVAKLHPGALIGEMTLIHGGAATADVTAEGPVRVLYLPRAQVLSEIDATPDIALAVGHALQAEVQRKLMVMNATGDSGLSPARRPPPSA